MRYLWLTFMVVLLVACGEDFFIANVKRYYFTVSPATPENHRIFNELFGNFNRRFNTPYLNLTHSGALPASETSTIVLTRGLLHADGKLGWGKWVRTSQLNSRQGFLQKPYKVRKDIYTMKLEFDRDYLQERYYSHKSNHKKQMRTLFLHELGHGFQMGHHPNRRSVMYREITDDYKDLNSYYRRVYDFLVN